PRVGPIGQTVTPETATQSAYSLAALLARLPPCSQSSRRGDASGRHADDPCSWLLPETSRFGAHYTTTHLIASGNVRRSRSNLIVPSDLRRTRHRIFNGAVHAHGGAPLVSVFVRAGRACSVWREGDGKSCTLPQESFR